MSKLDLLLPGPEPETMRPLWGTVTAGGQVLLDGDTVPLPASTPSLVPLIPGARAALDRYGKSLRVIGLLNAGGSGWTPPGVLVQYAGSVAPFGYLLADGALVSRTLYAALFAAIGTAYGSGDGSTTFALPNLKGRVPVGRDAAQTEFDALGESGGAKTNTHNHWTLNSNDNSQLYTTATGNAPRSRVVTKARSVNAGGSGSGGTREDSTYDETISVLQPFLVVNFIIKT